MNSWGRSREVERVKPALGEERHPLDASGQPELHIIPPAADDDEWAVWLNAACDHDGICLALRPTREAAIAEARETLEAALQVLR